MKVKNKPRHVIKDMWLAYVKKIMTNVPEGYKYKTKREQGFTYSIVSWTPGGKKSTLINYRIFSDIIIRFLSKGKQAVLKGESFYIPSMGYIAGKRIERDFRGKKRIDWGKSRRNGVTKSEDGKIKINKLIYEDGDDYCRIGWFKTAMMANIDIYAFEPTHSTSKSHCLNVNTPPNIGFKEQFSKALNLDITLKYRFVFSPLKDYIYVDEHGNPIPQ